MRDSLNHRGPDSAGSEYFQEDRVALGHLRLSIIDLSEDGRQPMTNEDGTVWLVFNGEIYNFKTLRNELEGLGHTFRSQTDSEVLIHGYEAWGLDVLQKIEGMYALALWDDNQKELILARDRVGIKPLFYYYNGQQIYFASELKGIVTDPQVPRKVDWESVADYLMYRFVPQPRTIYQGIRKLPPGHYLRFSFAQGDPITAPYWELKPGIDQPDNTEAIRTANSMLQASVQEQLVADVPLGVFLSGGYDSSALVMHMASTGADINSFAIGFENWGSSEHKFAKSVAETFGTSHQEWVLQDEMTGLAKELAYYYDEPLGGSSFLPTYLLSRQARKHVKVALSGDGGDEVFAGYRWHHRLHKAYFPPKVGLMGKLRGRTNPPPPTDFAKAYHTNTSWTKWRYSDLPKAFGGGHLNAYLDKDDAWVYRRFLPNEPLSPIKSAQLLDYHTMLPEVFLTKVDRASMANSLEVRVPFLNTPLMEYTMQLSDEVYYKPGVTKHLLREQLKGKVPKDILDKPKKGFSAPKRLFLTPEHIQEVLKDGFLVKEGLLSSPYLTQLLTDWDDQKLWALYILEHWFNTWQPTE